MVWISCGSLEAADFSRWAKWIAAIIVTKAVTRVWEEFDETMEEDN